MNKEERKERQDSYNAMMKERQDYKDRIMSLYNKLNYRDKLLFTFVVHFLADNPDTEQRPA